MRRSILLRHLLVIVTATVTIPHYSFSQYIVGDGVPHPSAVMQIVDATMTKGVIMPIVGDYGQVTNADAAATGMMVFDNARKKFYFFDGSNWQELSPWSYRKLASGGIESDMVANIATNVAIGNITPTEKLEVDGNIKARGDVTATGNVVADGNFQGNGIIPTGGIVMFSGSTSGNFDATGLGMAGTQYDGWAICNGQNTTPNLQGRFIVGVGTLGAATYTLNATGGEQSHTLTTTEMPSHNHSGSASGGSHVHGMNYSTVIAHTTGLTEGVLITNESVTDGDDDWYNDNTSGTAGVNALETSSGGGSHSHTLSINNTGGGGAHENRPPYYALAYIMRIQ